MNSTTKFIAHGATLSRFLGAILLFSPLGLAQAGSIHGTVQNGTTGQPAPGVQVILIQLQGGMLPVANVQSDGQGHFAFDNPALGAQPMLVRAVYHGVNFHQPVPPGTSEVQISVFESAPDPKLITIPTRVVFFQPNGSSLTVGEEYSIQNKSKPPQAYFRTDGNFEFILPDNAQLQQVAAEGPSGMPVVQATIDKPNNHVAISYAFRPGRSTVRYSYQMPYPGNSATVKIPALYPVERLLIVAPPTMHIAGDGLQAGGQEQGMNIYGRENVAVNTAVVLSVSGTAPPLGNNANSDQPSQDQSGSQANSSRSEMPAQNDSIQQVPGRLDPLKWPLIGGFVAVMALGAILLARKPMPVVASAGSNESANASVTPAHSISPGASSLADVDASVSSRLDSLKERLFRLELRHQAGTISDEEYAQERARTEKVLRDLVRG
ncbi:MAG: hypothetical protein NVS9B4_11250 [Candidatus Acidiferrum sp.]